MLTMNIFSLLPVTGQLTKKGPGNSPDLDLLVCFCDLSVLLIERLPYRCLQWAILPEMGSSRLLYHLCLHPDKNSRAASL